MKPPLLLLLTALALAACGGSPVTPTIDDHDHGFTYSFDVYDSLGIRQTTDEKYYTDIIARGIDYAGKSGVDVWRANIDTTRTYFRVESNGDFSRLQHVQYFTYRMDELPSRWVTYPISSPTGTQAAYHIDTVFNGPDENYRYVMYDSLTFLGNEDIVVSGEPIACVKYYEQIVDSVYEKGNGTWHPKLSIEQDPQTLWYSPKLGVFARMQYVDQVRSTIVSQLISYRK